MVFLGSGITGSLFSDLISVDEENLMLKIGVSTCLYGMIGACIGYMFINWPSLSVIGPVFKLKIILNLTYFIILLLLFADQASHIDFVSHFGALLAGIFLSSILKTMRDGPRQKYSRLVLGVLFILMILICFLIFYLAPQDGYSK